MRGNRGGGSSLWSLGRMKLGFPEVVASCSIFFLAGFFGSLLFSSSSVTDPEQDLSGNGLHRLRMMEMDEGDLVEMMPHGNSGDPRSTTVSFQVLSWKPRAVYFPKFATAEQCERIMNLARVNLKPSSVALRKGETVESTKGIRTSSGTFISAQEDEGGILSQIDEKIARVTMIPKENGEAYNVLRYEIGQRYASHYDAFSPKEYGPQKSQRVASFLLYLTDVEEGGETMFPFEDGSNMQSGYDYEKCIGLKVKPRRGDGLLFYSLYVNGSTIDPTSLHGSCPVIRGEKWVATKWLRTIDEGYS